MGFRAIKAEIQSNGQYSKDAGQLYKHKTNTQAVWLCDENFGLDQKSPIRHMSRKNTCLLTENTGLVFLDWWVAGWIPCGPQ